MCSNLPFVPEKTHVDLGFLASFSNFERSYLFSCWSDKKNYSHTIWITHRDLSNALLFRGVGLIYKKILYGTSDFGTSHVIEAPP